MGSVQHFVQTVQNLPQAAQGGATGVSLFTMAAAFLDKIHGPVVTVGAVLAACWIVIQATIAIHKYVHWLRTRKGK
jgi:hypothetical protein